MGAGVGAVTGAGGRRMRQRLGDCVQFGEGGGVGVVRLEGGALAGEGGPAEGGDVVEVSEEGVLVAAMGTSRARIGKTQRAAPD